MENGSFFELIGTLFVGGMVMTGLAIGTWIIMGRAEDPWTWFNKVKLLPTKLIGVVLLAFVGFGFGVFGEGITDHMTDSESKLHNPVSKIQTSILRREGRHRLLTLFQKKDDEYKIRVLGKEVFSKSTFASAVIPNELFLSNPESFLNGKAGTKQDYMVSIYGPEKDVKKNCYENRCDKDINEIAEEVVEKYANMLYYPAKNWAYTEPNYFKELERIQRRIDWARSSFLVMSWIVTVGSLWLLFTGVGFLIYRKDSADINVAKDFPFSEKKEYFKTGFIRTLFVTLITLLVSYIACISYGHAEEQFNERVYGYFVSYLQRSAWELDEDPRIRYGALLWMQTSAEYHALCCQIYQIATNRAIEIKRARHYSAQKTPAVVMDIDETVLDNTAFNAKLISRKQSYSPERWQNWIATRSEEVRPVPGAKSFVKQMKRHDIEVIYISNRHESLKAQTLSTLERLGFGNSNELESRLYLRTDTSSKQKRRAIVRKKYDVLLYVGDNLADFAEIFSSQKAKTVSQRWTLVKEDEYLERWGYSWFVLPNPLYGDWPNVIDWEDPLFYSSKAYP